MRIVHIIKGDLYGGSDTLSRLLFSQIGEEYEQLLLLLEREGIDPYKKFNAENLYRIKLKNEILFVNLYCKISKLIKADIIHLHHIKLWIFLFPLIVFKEKLISSFHINFGSGIKKGYLQNLLIFLIINYTTLFSKRLIFLTKGQKEHLKKYSIFKNSFEKKSRIIPNFISKEKIIEKKKRYNKNIIFVGRYTKIKGFEDLTEVARLVPELNFNLIGNNEYLPNIKNMYNIGEIDNSKMHKEYDKNSILILPSYTEAFPMVILEAMARGLVILVSDLPGMREIVKEGHNGYLFPPGDIQKMKKIILYLKNNPKEIERISKNNLKDIWKFTQEKQIPKYFKLYKEVLKDVKK
ncbi:MAG: glycosyltransferase family 4 protein [Nanoarchaeota archaeon]